jgi:hypothetical protein
VHVSTHPQHRVSFLSCCSPVLQMNVREEFGHCWLCDKDVLTLRTTKDPRDGRWKAETSYNRCSNVWCDATACLGCVGFDYSQTVLDCSGWEGVKFCEEDCFKRWCADAGMNLQGQYLVDVQPGSTQVGYTPLLTPITFVFTPLLCPPV